jgi:hypothetical protein
MRSTLGVSAACVLTLCGAVLTGQDAPPPAAARMNQNAADVVAQNQVDPWTKEVVARLDFDRYKATIQALARFGDRREGTQRNRDAADWIEAQFKSYGYANTERMTYPFVRPGRGCGPSVPVEPPPAGARGGARAGAGAGRGATPNPNASGFRSGPGGSRIYGNRGRVGVNCDPLLQTDAAVRELNSQPILDGPVPQVFATKIGTTRPGEMYIIGAHMDGIGYGQAANDDGSGTALVMEIARILASPDITTDRSIRFVLWNGEESGLYGSRAYVSQRKDLQGREDPPGSGRYPEPTWLAMIQHDMMMWDHGMPLADGSLPKEQRPEADINIEFQSTSARAAESQALAWVFHSAAQRYATDYPATVGPHMTNTDSEPFQDLIPSISLRENERGRDIQAGWDPNWHQVSDMLSTYTDKDFRLGFNAAQTTLAAIAQLAGLGRR